MRHIYTPCLLLHPVKPKETRYIHAQIVLTETKLPTEISRTQDNLPLTLSGVGVKGIPTVKDLISGET